MDRLRFFMANGVLAAPVEWRGPTSYSQGGDSTMARRRSKRSDWPLVFAILAAFSLFGLIARSGRHTGSFAPPRLAIPGNVLDSD